MQIGYCDTEKDMAKKIESVQTFNCTFGSSDQCWNCHSMETSQHYTHCQNIRLSLHRTTTQRKTTETTTTNIEEPYRKENNKVPRLDADGDYRPWTWVDQDRVSGSGKRKKAEARRRRKDSDDKGIWERRRRGTKTLKSSYCDIVGEWPYFHLNRFSQKATTVIIGHCETVAVSYLSPCHGI